MVQRKKKFGDHPEIDRQVADLANRRDVAQAALNYLRLVKEHSVDSEVVSRGASLGLGQSELAAQLGMSKRDVGRLQRDADPPHVMGADQASFARLRDVFLSLIWGAKPSAGAPAERARVTTINFGDPAVVADILAVLIDHAELPDDGPYRRGVLAFEATSTGDTVTVTIPNPDDMFPPAVYELTVRRSADFVPSTKPMLGGAVGLGVHDRPTAIRRAEYWNQQLVADPEYGPSSGLLVGVAEKRDADGRWPLVWTQA